MDWTNRLQRSVQRLFQTLIKCISGGRQLRGRVNIDLNERVRSRASHFPRFFVEIVSTDDSYVFVVLLIHRRPEFRQPVYNWQNLKYSRERAPIVSDTTAVVTNATRSLREMNQIERERR